MYANKDEIDLVLILEALNRHRKLIFKYTGLTLLLSILYLLAAPPIWKGEFQIVLNDKSKNRKESILESFTQSPIASELVNFEDSGKDLDTQIEILSSPLVLKAVYDDLKEYKKNKNINVSNWVYKDWVKNSLYIGLEKGTRVLYLSFKDKDKEIIIPTLKQISSRYKDYADRDRRKNIEKTISYLKEQINYYLKKSDESLTKFQQFAFDNDLTALVSDSGLPNKAAEKTNIEIIRLNAANKIRLLDLKIKQLQDSSSDQNEFLLRSMVEDRNTFKDLDAINNELLIAKTKYTENHRTIIDLRQRKEITLNKLKETVNGILLSNKAEAIAEKLSAERPQEVIVKLYRLRERYLRNKSTLAELDGLLQATLLEQAKQEDPWELITTPTLLRKPASPKKFQTLTLALFAGLVIGSGSALRKEIADGIFYNEELLISKMPLKLLASLRLDEKNNWQIPLNLILEGPLNCKDNEKIAIIPLGEIEKSQTKIVINEFQRLLNKEKLLVTKDINEASNCAKQLLIATPGKISNKDISNLQEQISLLKNDFSGWILLDN